MARKARTNKEEPAKKKSVPKKEVEKKEAPELPDMIEQIEAEVSDFLYFLKKADTVPAMNKVARNASIELRKTLAEFRNSSLNWEKESD